MTPTYTTYPGERIQMCGHLSNGAAYVCTLPHHHAGSCKAVLIAPPRDVAPGRIQRKRERGWTMPVGAIYVGRPTRFGNPFAVGDAVYQETLQGSVYREGTIHVTDRATAVALYSLWLGAETDDPRPTSAEIATLRGHPLACWCPLEEPCHADVLLRLANL